MLRYVSCGALAVLLLHSGGCLAGAPSKELKQDEIKQEDQPIYDMPIEVADAAKRQVASAYLSVIKFPQLTFVLARKSFRVGEVVWGTLTVKNVDKRYSFEVSPPYNGLGVSTLSVWAKRGGTSAAGDSRWLPPFEACKMNHGIVAVDGKAFPGCSIVLGPGESREYRIPLNVWEFRRPETCGTREGMVWFPGISLSKEGRYLLYIKYFDIGGVVSSTADGDPKSSYKKLTDDDPLRPPMRPVVLGPFEVEMQPAADPGISDLLVEWQRLKDKSAEGSVLNLNLAALNAVIGLMSDKDRELKASFQLCRIRQDFHNITAKASVDKRGLSELLEQTKRIREELGTSPVKDAYLVTECYMLSLLGKADEARNLAEKCSTPDAETFLREQKTTGTHSGGPDR